MRSQVEVNIKVEKKPEVIKIEECPKVKPVKKKVVYAIVVDREKRPPFQLKEIPFELVSAKHPLVKRSAAIFSDKPFAEQFLEACIKSYENNEKIRKNLIDKLKNSR